MTSSKNITSGKESKFSLKNLFDTKTLPRWFVIYSYISLYPVLLWPFIVYTAINLYDTHNTAASTFFYFILMIIYPVIFFSLIIIGFKIYPKQKLIAILLPLILFSSGILFVIFGN